jgi:hypothetical protein
VVVHGGRVAPAVCDAQQALIETGREPVMPMPSGGIGMAGIRLQLFDQG